MPPEKVCKIPLVTVSWLLARFLFQQPRPTVGACAPQAICPQVVIVFAVRAVELKVVAAAVPSPCRLDLFGRIVFANLDHLFFQRVPANRMGIHYLPAFFQPRIAARIALKFRILTLGAFTWPPQP